MKRILPFFVLLGSFSTASAGTESAAQVCAEAASLVTGDTSFEVQDIRQPLVSVSNYEITLESTSSKEVQCIVAADRIRDLSINGERTSAS